MKYEKYESLFRTVSNCFNFQGCFKRKKYFNALKFRKNYTQWAFTCLELTIETLEQVMKYVQS